MQTAQQAQTATSRSAVVPSSEKNANMTAARVAKNDEFYTRLEDIENELKHYKRHFKNKVVFCNCDDPEWSNFWKFFYARFDAFGLKRLVGTHYNKDNQDDTTENAYVLVCEVVEKDAAGKLRTTKTVLQGDGDFRSPECVELLEQADIVCTNPPFSLFREFVALLIEKKKKFLIIGHMNAISYRGMFSLIQKNNVWLGITSPKKFRIKLNQEEYKSFGNICWFTNLDHKQRNEEMVLYKSYAGNEADYPTYANYKAINVDKIKDIPMDYYGEVGVPITFLTKYNPSQFEVVGSSMDLSKHMKDFAKADTYLWVGPRFYLEKADGTYRRLYDRIVIKRIAE